MYKTKPINFFTPITFVWNPERKWQTLSNIIEDYFCWTGKKLMFVRTIQNNNQDEHLTAPLTVHKISPLKLKATTALKIISLATGIIPLLMLVGKAITRSHFNFREFSK